MTVDRRGRWRDVPRDRTARPTRPRPSTPAGGEAMAQQDLRHGRAALVGGAEQQDVDGPDCRCAAPSLPRVDRSVKFSWMLEEPVVDPRTPVLIGCRPAEPTASTGASDSPRARRSDRRGAAAGRRRQRGSATAAAHRRGRRPHREPPLVALPRPRRAWWPSGSAPTPRDHHASRGWAATARSRSSTRPASPSSGRGRPRAPRRRGGLAHADGRSAQAGGRARLDVAGRRRARGAAVDRPKTCRCRRPASRPAA